MAETPTDQPGVQIVLDWAGEYLLPYWPWIALLVIGAIVLRVIVRRAMPCLVLAVVLVLFSGVGFSGLVTWLRDRGIIDPGWLPW